MVVIIGENGEVTLSQGNVLGCVNENGLRRHVVIHPKFDGAYYSMMLESEGAVAREVKIENGLMTVDGDILKKEGELRAQFAAKRSDKSGSFAFMSEIFTVRVCPSLN